MFVPNTIDGIDELNKTIPEELQYWHKFGHIIDLHYHHVFDYEYCDYISCIELSLTDYKNSYIINLCLYNVSGTLCFNICNGFYSGLTIDDFSDMGYEKNCRFRLSSFEQDIDFTIYCEKIKVELQK